MELKIVKVLQCEKGILNNLMQFYFYDFSEFVDCDIKDDGLYGEYPYFDDYWIDAENRFPYFIKLDEKLIGFVLVRCLESSENDPHFSIAEYFIMKKYRRLGFGKKAAMKVFDMHKGHWEVSQVEKNVPAQIFWNSVINKYTDGKFNNRVEEGKCIQGFIN